MAPKKTIPKKKEPTAAAAKRQAQVVEKLMLKVEEKLGRGDVKATLGDYIRLVQLEKELEEEEPKKIEVRWVEPEESKSDSEA